MIELFFIVFYIKLRTFSYIKLYITFNRKRSKYYHEKKNFESVILSRTGAPVKKKKSFFHLFPKILTIVVSTSTWSQNEGKYLYFMGMKEFLPESDFVYGLRTVLCERKFGILTLACLKVKKKKNSNICQKYKYSRTQF